MVRTRLRKTPGLESSREPHLAIADRFRTEWSRRVSYRNKEGTIREGSGSLQAAALVGLLPAKRDLKLKLHSRILANSCGGQNSCYRGQRESGVSRSPNIPRYGRQAFRDTRRKYASPGGVQPDFDLRPRKCHPRRNRYRSKAVCFVRSFEQKKNIICATIRVAVRTKCVL